MKFKNKVAVVTGAGSGIGAGISKNLAANGAFVIVTDVNEDDAKQTVTHITRKGLKAQAMKLDVTNDNNIKEVISYIHKYVGNIDYWVNNAGVSNILPFLEHTEALWDNTMNINLKAQFLCCQEVITQMIETGGGSIVNMSSQSGKVGTNHYQAYCASKFGVIGLTQSLAKEFGSKGIRINAVCPGVVYTPMWEQQKNDYAAKSNMDPNHVLDYFKGKIPMRRLGTVDDVAHTVNFLLSDEASYITGQSINVNGGDIMF